MKQMKKLNPDRLSITHKAVIRCAPTTCLACGAETSDSRIKFFFTVGLFEDGSPAELFLHMDRSGSVIDGFAKSWALAISLCLREGVPLSKLVEKFSFQLFEPSGFTDNPEIRTAKSIVDYVIRWMDHYFNKKGEKKI